MNQISINLALSSQKIVISSHGRVIKLKIKNELFLILRWVFTKLIMEAFSEVSWIKKTNL